MASNTTVTTASTRSNMGADTVLTGVLKDVYLPGLTNTLYFDDAFTRLIQSMTAKLDATGRRIIHAFETQRSAGVGPIAEGGDFRDSVPIDGVQGTEWLKYDNIYFALSGPAIETVKAGEGSYVDIIDRHMTSLMKSSKLDLERQICGQGDARLGELSAAPTTSTVSVNGPGFFDTQFIEPGMIVEFRAPTFGTVTLRGVQSTTTYTSTMVVSTTEGNKRTSTNGTFDTKTDAGSSSYVVESGNSTAANDWITRKNAYTGTVCLEMNGIMNLISDGSTNTGTYIGAESASNFTHIWGLDRTSYSWLQSNIVDISAELDEENLLQTLIESEYQKQADPNMLIVSPRALNKYFLNTKDDRRFNTMTAMNWVGGYTGLGIQLGTRQLMLTALGSIPAGYAFLINTNDFAFMRPPGMSGYKWLTSEGGAILTQKEGSDNQFATAVDYRQFVCMDPRLQTKMHSITEV